MIAGLSQRTSTDQSQPIGLPWSPVVRIRHERIINVIPVWTGGYIGHPSRPISSGSAPEERTSEARAGEESALRSSTAGVTLGCSFQDAHPRPHRSVRLIRPVSV